MSKRILITGGLGFLGGRISKYLSSQKYDIVVSSRRVVERHEWIDGCNMIQISWDDSQSIENACQGIDCIIHTSGVNARECENDPELALKVNGLATASLLKAAVSSGVKKIIYFSTAHVYQSPLNGVFDEEVCPKNLHPYATSHRAGEDIILYAGEKKMLDAVVVRLSNAYGVPISPETNCWMLLVNDLCRQAVVTGKLKLASNGKQQRDFISIMAILSALSGLIENDQISGIYNLGSGRAVSVLDMARVIQDRSSLILGYTPDIIVGESGSNDRVEDSSLEFRINKILSDGIVIDDKRDKEIDNLLRFCQIKFMAGNL